jgi:hypothetical protein
MPHVVYSLVYKIDLLKMMVGWWEKIKLKKEKKILKLFGNTCTPSKITKILHPPTKKLSRMELPLALPSSGLRYHAIVICHTAVFNNI